MKYKGKHFEMLGPVDTAFLYVDRPETPMNIGALTIYDGPIDFDQFSKYIDARIYQAPIYQQKIIQAPLMLGNLMWAFDPDFHIGNHVFSISVDAPGTIEQLRELTGHLVSGMLDRSKPLWEIYLINGIEGNLTGVFFKVHHCMVDGLSAVELFTMLMDLTPEMSPPPKKPPYDPPYLPNPLELILDGVKREIPHKLSVLQKLGGDLLQLASVAQDKEKRRKALVGLSYLINDNLKPIRKLGINGTNSGRMTLAWAEFSLAEVRAIRSSRNASVNDVMLTVYSTAIGNYLRALGDSISKDLLRVLVPVNVREDVEKGSFGNRISVLPVDIPFRIDDPLERLRAVADYTQVMKNSSLSKGLDMVLTLPALLPAISQPLVWGIAPVAFAFLAHSWCTNVAGPQIPVYLMGRKLLHSYGYFPLNPSMGLCCVITSYNQRISMTLVADAAIVPDVTELKSFLESAFVALRSAAKVPPMEPIALDRVKTEPAPRAEGDTRKAAPEPARAAPEVRVEVAAPQPVETAPSPTPETKAEPVVPVEAAPAAVITPILAAVAEPATASPVVEASVVEAPAQPDKAEARVEGVVVEAIPQVVVEVNEPVAVAPAAASSVSASAASEEGPSAAAAGDHVSAAQVDAESAAPGATAIASGPPALALPADTAYPNGRSAQVETPAPAVEKVETKVEAAPRLKGKARLFSQEWAEDFHEALNNNADYYRVSKGWEAGPLAMVMNAAPQNGFPRPAAVILDLHKGKCRGARSLPPHEAMNEASFVIEGDYASWMKVLNGQAEPLMMIMRGKLRLKKGSIARLLPFTQSATELVHTAQTIS